MALPESVQKQINQMFASMPVESPRETTARELAERNRNRLRVCAALLDGLNYANPKSDVARYGDTLRDVSDYITKTQHSLDLMRRELHQAQMKIMKQEAKLSGLRVALAHSQNYAKSAVKQKKAAADKTLASLEKFVATELKKSEMEE